VVGCSFAGMELGSLTGAECVEHLRATQRAYNVACAARLAAVVEVGLCAPGSWETVARMEAPDRYSRDELRPALGISAPSAAKVMDLAWVVCRRLPELHAAMAAGELDEARAWAIAHWTEQLADAHAHLICGDVLPHCLLSAEDPWPTGAEKNRAGIRTGSNPCDRRPRPDGSSGSRAAGAFELDLMRIRVHR